MQAEVIRRMLEHKQEELDILVQQKSDLLARANDQIASQALPSLPEEIIMQIFADLYWMEGNHRNLNDDFESTLQRFIVDSGTSIEWKDLARSQIPTVIGGKTGINPMRSMSHVLRTRFHLFGPNPRVISLQELDKVSEDLLQRPSTTIYVDLSKPEGSEKMFQFPWHNLFLSTGNLEPPAVISSTFWKHLPGKLENTDRLEVDSSIEISIPDTSVPLVPDKVLDGYPMLAPKLRVALLRSWLLPGLSPFLSNVTIIEVGISSAVDESGRTSIDVLERLASCSNTLSSLTLSNTINHWSNHPSRVLTAKCRRISFPLLKRLKLTAFSECVLQDILSAVNCPLLSHLSLVVLGGLSIPCNIDDRVSAAFLHDLFPELTFIYVNFLTRHVRRHLENIFFTFTNCSTSAKRTILCRPYGP